MHTCFLRPEQEGEKSKMKLKKEKKKQNEKDTLARSPDLPPRVTIRLELALGTLELLTQDAANH